MARQAQEQKNLQVQVELQSVRSQVQLLGPQGYLLKSAIESGKIQFMVIPQGSNVSVPMPIVPSQTPSPTPR